MSDVAETTILSLLICVALLVPADQIHCDTVDDDGLLEFYWDAASGDVDHYNVYLSIDEDDYLLVGTTSVAPTEESPYTVSIKAKDGEKYRLRVEAEGADGTTGPMSEPSDLVWCKFRSPGDANGLTPGDADANSRVGAGDWAILCIAWNTNRGNDPFDYRADLNYDDFVDIYDITIMASGWGNMYSGVKKAPDSPATSDSHCSISLIGQENIRVGDEVSMDIVVEEARDVYAMDFEVLFDPAHLEVEKIERGAFFPTGTANLEQANRSQEIGSSSQSSWIAGRLIQSQGKISPTLAAVPPGSSTGMDGDGVVATLKFRAISDGVSAISLRNLHAYDSELSLVSAGNTNAVLTIGTAIYLLAQNYPNPFNPETWIPYALAQDCDRVVIRIYNVVGEEVRKLSLGPREAGFYTTKDRAAHWDGKNADGIRIAGGVYFYQIKAGEFSAVKKMAVLE